MGKGGKAQTGRVHHFLHTGLPFNKTTPPPDDGGSQSKPKTQFSAVPGFGARIRPRIEPAAEGGAWAAGGKVGPGCGCGLQQEGPGAGTPGPGPAQAPDKKDTEPRLGGISLRPVGGHATPEWMPWGTTAPVRNARFVDLARVCGTISPAIGMPLGADGGAGLARRGTRAPTRPPDPALRGTRSRDRADLRLRRFRPARGLELVAGSAHSAGASPRPPLRRERSPRTPRSSRRPA